MSSQHQLHLVNLYGSVGSGKSTIAAGVFSNLKALRYSVNLIVEFSRELGYDRSMAINDMPYVIGNQWHRIQQSFRFDFAINDCPLALWTVYHSEMDKECADLIFALERKFPSLNYLLERKFPMYHPYRGKASDILDQKMQEQQEKIRQMLDEHDIQYKILESNEAAVDAIVADILVLQPNPISQR